MKKYSWALFLLVASLLAPIESSAETVNPGVTLKTLVKAKPDVVYEAIRHAHENNSDSCRVLSQTKNTCLVEEKFDGLPIIGNAKCIYEEFYRSPSTIDYRMRSSDKFKAFEGSWSLTPQANGETLVELRSYIDTGLRIPFAKKITETTTASEIREQLAEIKKAAEAHNNKVAAK
ncbi:MAG: SRPBCC family protein [Candidatus Obscuribacterales bacterium]|nr:SRPBCC family protein [Candidatus Obscuribacterales bacterium]